VNVAIFSGKFPAISESFIARQAQALNATVYRKTSEENIKVPPGVKVVQLPNPKKKRTKNKWRCRIREIWWASCYKNTYLMPACMERALGAAFLESRPDVLLAQYGTTGLQLIRPCMKANVPLVIHFHGFDLSKEYRDRWYRFSCKKLLRVARALIVVNNIQRERLLSLGAPPEKIYLIPCGVPVEEFTPAESVSEQPCRFLAVGRFVPKKCHINTIKAFAKCAKRSHDVQLTMIGDGPLRDDSQRMVDELGITQQVRFMGAQPNEIVKREMMAAGAFVHHSITSLDGDEEGWPIVVGEAMSCGLPVISTSHPGIIDQVADGETGFLVEENDWKEMAERMFKIAENPQLRRSMGVAGRRRIERIGNLENSLYLLKDVLRKAILNHKPNLC